MYIYIHKPLLANAGVWDIGSLTVWKHVKPRMNNHAAWYGVEKQPAVVCAGSYRRTVPADRRTVLHGSQKQLDTLHFATEMGQLTCKSHDSVIG